MTSRKRTRVPRRGGFTLVEVIVAGIIAALVIGSVSMSLGQLGKAKRTSKDRLEMFMRADAAITAIRRDVASVIRADDLFFTRFLLTDGHVTGRDGAYGRDELLVFSTRLRPVRNIDNFTGEGVEYETQYRIEEDGLGPMLWQRRDAVPDEYAAGGGLLNPVVEGIVGLDIEAYDGEDWWSEWDSDVQGLPVAVSIMVTASGHRDGADPWDAPIQSLRTVVPIDRVLQPRDIFETEEMELRALEAEEAEAEGGIAGTDEAGPAPSLEEALQGLDGERFTPDPGSINPDEVIRVNGQLITRDGRIVNGDGTVSAPPRNAGTSGRTGGGGGGGTGLSDN